MQPHKRRILCIEDDKDTCELLSTVLGISSYQVKSAGTIADALCLASNETFSLYLLDRRLPDGDGIELCRQIREFDPHTPILFYSAAARESDKQEAIAAGATGYMIKPGDVVELVCAITFMINQVKDRFRSVGVV